MRVDTRKMRRDFRVGHSELKWRVVEARRPQNGDKRANKMLQIPVRRLQLQVGLYGPSARRTRYGKLVKGEVPQPNKANLNVIAQPQRNSLNIEHARSSYLSAESLKVHRSRTHGKISPNPGLLSSTRTFNFLLVDVST